MQEICSFVLMSKVDSKPYGNELNYKLRIRHGLHGFHGFSAMINYVKQPC